MVADGASKKRRAYLEEPDTPLSNKGIKNKKLSPKTTEANEIPSPPVLISPNKLTATNGQHGGPLNDHNKEQNVELISSPQKTKSTLDQLIDSKTQPRTNPKEKPSLLDKLTSIGANNTTLEPAQQQLPVLRYVRFETLKKVLNKSLQESTKSLSLDKIKECYPELAKSKDGLDALNLGRLQLLDYWEKTCLNEFSSIYEERDLEKKLNELDEMIYEAKMRKLKGDSTGEEKPLLINELRPEELVANKVNATKEKINNELNDKLKEIRKENAKLLKEFDSITETSVNCLTRMNDNLQYLQKYLNVENIDNLIPDEKFSDLINYITKNYI